MRGEQRIDCGDDPAEAFAIEREPARDAHQTVRCIAVPERVGEQRPEVSEVSGDHRALFAGLGGEVDRSDRPRSPGVLADGDHVAAALAKLSRDFGREVLVEQ
jgi:hypothetical protein